DKFTLWSGLIGGFFLQLSYFGTDQSQVGRYLNGRTVREAKLGMMFNGLVKIPMQFIVLLTGVLVFVYFLFHPSPVHWNAQNAAALKGVPAFDSLNAGHDRHEADVREHAVAWLDALRADDADRKTSSREALNNALVADAAVRDSVRALVEERLPGSDPRDDDHIFLSFVMSHFPTGILGLFVAVMFCASMSTSAAELSALASTTTVDVIRRDWSEQGQIRATRWATIAFGLLAMAFAGVASQLGNLIQAVNTIGSLFYGTILGIFLVAFLLKRVQGLALFVAALVAEAVILVLFALQSYEVIRPIGFLWFNLIAPAIVLLGASGLQALLPGAGIERTIDRSE
ncbi:MAG TPA: sodium:solute symporter, partial [Flavobacteriales bacterium]|nr:sodium:solute symporter [Flavobacteriales bacterium]